MARVNSKICPRTQNRTSSVRVQKDKPNPTQNANPTQPNPYSSNWVGPSCLVVGLNVHPSVIKLLCEDSEGVLSYPLPVNLIDKNLISILLVDRHEGLPVMMIILYEDN